MMLYQINYPKTPIAKVEILSRRANIYTLSQMYDDKIKKLEDKFEEEIQKLKSAVPASLQNIDAEVIR